MKEKNTADGEQNKKGFNPIFAIILLILVIGGGYGAVLYWQLSQLSVYIEKSEINVPLISLSPSESGTLDRILVAEGDIVRTNMILAYVDGKPIRAKTNGIIVTVQNIPGQLVSTQSSIIQMINPAELRVIGHLEEDKGLSEIKPGQKVRFNVDAFAGKDYYGTVESVSLISRQSDIVFSISDKRAQQQFDVKVKYNIDIYPELKNGMSAKMWVTK